MKRPTWATIVGILGIIFGCFGILGAGQEILLPKMLEMQREIFEEMQQAASKQKQESTSNEIRSTHENKDQSPLFFPEIFKPMQKMLEVPDWFGPWSMFTGITKAFISAFYLLASILLLQTKPSSIRLFYWAAGSSIFLSIVKGIVTVSALSFMGVAMMFGSAFGALIDIVLIIVVATGNKKAFQPPLPSPAAV